MLSIQHWIILEGWTKTLATKEGEVLNDLGQRIKQGGNPMEEKIKGLMGQTGRVKHEIIS